MHTLTTPQHVYYGDIVNADIPFKDGTGSKVRPALVEDVIGGKVVVRPIYTRQRPGYTRISRTRSNGLLHDSYLDATTQTIGSHKIRSIRGEHYDTAHAA